MIKNKLEGVDIVTMVVFVCLTATAIVSIV